METEALSLGSRREADLGTGIMAAPCSNSTWNLVLRDGKHAASLTAPPPAVCVPALKSNSLTLLCFGF